MKTLTIVQGSAEWHAHRGAHFNASDAPAMLGISPYKSRAQLLRERATGINPVIDAATQRRFDDGHRFEALARPLAERIIGEDLYPCTGVSDCGLYSASFDGLTLLGDAAFEHKTLNESLRYSPWDEGNGWHLPEHYRAQMEHQMLVSGAERVLFMASKWNDDELIEERHCWYAPDPDMRARLIAGWEQYAADLAAYQHAPTPSPAPTATPVAGFGALSLRVEGRVLASNLDAFKAGAEAFIARLPRPDELQSDQDFADADAAVKACAEAESRIKAATDAALAQMSDVDAILRTAGDIAETIRAARLALEKAVKLEKESRKAAIVASGVDEVREHYRTINATLGEHAILAPQSLSLDIGGAIKGLRTITSITDAVSTAVANAKIAASQRAEAVRASIATYTEAASGYYFLFPDAVAICGTKSSDDLRNLVAARIAEHQQREAERERIRAEEAAKACGPAASATPHSIEVMQCHSPGKGEPGYRMPAEPTCTARLKLGEINARIAPLTITADGLAQLGFQAVGTERAAKLYRESDFPAICAAIVDVVQRAASERRAA